MITAIKDLALDQTFKETKRSQFCFINRNVTSSTYIITNRV